MDEVFSGVGDKQVEEEEVCWMQAGSLSCWRGSPSSPDSNPISEQYPSDDVTANTNPSLDLHGDHTKKQEDKL